MLKRKKDGGFTLIELMIVIAVIGILAVVLVPKVGSLKTTAKNTGIDTNVKIVQAYVQSRITYWADKDTSQADIADEIKTAISSAPDKMQNPFTPGNAGTTINNKIGDNTLLPGDALQIVATEDADSTVGLGSVVVVVPADGELKKDGIIIKGHNDAGAEYSTQTIKP